MSHLTTEQRTVLDNSEKAFLESISAMPPGKVINGPRPSQAEIAKRMINSISYQEQFSTDLAALTKAVLNRDKD